MKKLPSHETQPHRLSPPSLRMIAWEVTRRCNLNCIHCRAAARREPYPGELSRAEALGLIDEMASLGNPVVILTGGEPLLREDIFDLIRHGNSRGLRMVIAPNGTLIDPATARRLKETGIQRVSISLDGPTAIHHDQIRQVPGAFEGALRGIEFLKEAGLEFQINTTVTQSNWQELPSIMELAIRLGAVAHHIFLLVPTGRGKELKRQTLTPDEYERILNWFYDQRGKAPLQLKATCAPQFQRILRQRAKAEGKKIHERTFGFEALSRGCLGGIGFCFISHIGDVQPCGYLEVRSGNVRERPLRAIWEDSPVFQRLRDFSAYQGRCGRCEYIAVCGGCRARAFAETEDFMAEEPLCVYQPSKPRRGNDFPPMDGRPEDLRGTRGK